MEGEAVHLVAADRGRDELVALAAVRVAGQPEGDLVGLADDRIDGLLDRAAFQGGEVDAAIPMRGGPVGADVVDAVALDGPTGDRGAAVAQGDEAARIGAFFKAAVDQVAALAPPATSAAASAAAVPTSQCLFVLT